jgi:hypothetical protein
MYPSPGKSDVWNLGQVSLEAAAHPDIMLDQNWDIFKAFQAELH